MAKTKTPNLLRTLKRRVTRAWPFGNLSLILTVVAVVGIGGFIAYKIFAKSYPVNNWSYWAPRIRACESGGQVYGRVNWTIYNSVNTSSGHASGGYQITSGTWRAFGGTAYASEARYASPSQQDVIAKKIFNHYGGGSTGSWRASYHCWKPGGVIRSAPALPSCVLNDQVCGSTASNPGSGTSVTRSSPSCSHHGISRGSSGACVYHLQYYLRKIARHSGIIEENPGGRDWSRTGIDGVFGPNTEAAIIHYKRRWRLTNSSGGYDSGVGSKTWSQLHSSCNNINANPRNGVNSC